MAKAWTAPEGDVKPDPIETKIGILQAERNNLSTVFVVCDTLLTFDEGREEIGTALAWATSQIDTAIQRLEEQRATP